MVAGEEAEYGVDPYLVERAYPRRIQGDLLSFAYNARARDRAGNELRWLALKPTEDGPSLLADRRFILVLWRGRRSAAPTEVFMPRHMAADRLVVVSEDRVTVGFGAEARTGGVDPMYVMALDQGTTSSRAIVFDRGGGIRSAAQRETTQHFPQPGWVEQDAGEIWETQAAFAVEALRSAGIDGGQQSLMGQLCTDRGSVKTTYGTGRFALLHTGTAPQPSERGLLTTIACSTDRQSRYALEGSVFTGGAARNDLLMQFQADVTGLPVMRSEVTESMALGAAYLAGLAVGYWQGIDELAGNWRAERRFEPSLPQDRVAGLRTSWSRAVERAGNWAAEEQGD